MFRLSNLAQAEIVQSTEKKVDTRPMPQKWEVELG